MFYVNVFGNITIIKSFHFIKQQNKPIIYTNLAVNLKIQIN